MEVILEVSNPCRADATIAEFSSSEGSFSTWQVALFRNVFSQLARSPFRTRNSNDASLFFIPYDAGVETYIYRDGTFRGGGNPLAKVISKYLNGSDVFRRHHGNDHFMIYSASMLSQTISSKLKRLFRICANVTIFTFETFEGRGVKAFKGFKLPNLVAVPYPSIYHWNERTGARSVPVLLADQVPRVYLSSLLASTQTNQPDSNRFRKLLLHQCQRADRQQVFGEYKRVCWHRDIGSRDNRNNFDMTVVSAVYRSSVFCLMPPGDTGTRRGIFDAVLCGCIPVLFGYLDMHGIVNPMEQYGWHYSLDEIENSFIYLNGTNVSYFSMLAKIGSEEIALRQAYLRRIAFKTQYSFPSPIWIKGGSSRQLPTVREALQPWSPPEPDAVIVMMNKLFAKQEEQRLF